MFSRLIEAYLISNLSSIVQQLPHTPAHEGFPPPNLPNPRRYPHHSHTCYYPRPARPPYRPRLVLYIRADEGDLVGQVVCLVARSDREVGRRDRLELQAVRVPTRTGDRGGKRTEFVLSGIAGDGRGVLCGLLGESTAPPEKEIMFTKAKLL